LKALNCALHLCNSPMIRNPSKREMSVSTALQKSIPGMGIRSLLAYLLLTVAYLVSGKLGLMLALPPGYVSPIFPPAGIAVAAALIGGRKPLPWIFIGSLLLNIWVGYSDSRQIDVLGFTVAAVIAIASMLQAAIGGWGLRRLIGYPVSFDHGAEVLCFMLLAPVICLISASLSVSGLWVLGIIDSASFATNWAVWWVGDTLGLLVVLPLIMIVAGEPRALWKSRMRTVAVPILLFFALFVVIFLKVNQRESDDSLMEFRQLSQHAVNQIQTKLEEQESVLEQTAALFIHDTKVTVTREEFHRFVEKSLIRFPVIQALEWVSLVDAAHRTSFEAAQRNDVPDFEIREQNAAGQLRRAGERSSYYPVTYIEPLAGNEPALGVDLASNPERREALSEAILSETAVMSSTVRLVPARQQQAGAMLILAVNPHDKQSWGQSGVVLSVLRMGDFMDKLLLNTRPMLYTRLVDLDAQTIIYDNFLPGAQQALYVHAFDFGKRHYRLETAPTPAYVRQHRGWQSWSLLAAGILGTGLLGALLLLSTGYTARIEAQVEDRTRKLKASESRFRNTLENAPIGMAIVALDGRLMQVNHALCVMLGYKKEELEKLTYSELTHTEDRDRSLSSVQRLLDGKLSSYRSEKRYLRKDGQVVWVLLAASIERDSSGAPLYLIGQIEDITERKQAEEFVRTSQARFNTIFNQAPLGIALIDSLTGQIYEVNPRFAEIAGRTIEEMATIDWMSITHPDDVQEDLDNMALLNAGKISGFRMDKRYLRPDGSFVWINMTIAPLRVEQNISPRHLCMIDDITERKQAEAELRVAATIFESNEGMLITDAQKVILQVNHAFTKITGYAAEEAIGQTPHLLSSGRHDAAFYAAMWDSIRRCGSWQGEIWDRRKNGEVYPEQLTITEVRNEGEEVTHYVATLNDITQRKTAEEQIRNLAFYDALTQLPNRRLLDDRLGQAMAASRRSGHYGALMFLDLDNFKPLNDKYGHGVGDLLLIEVARRIGRCVRETDTVARFGGDEFVVMLSELDADKAESVAQAGIVAEKIRVMLAEPYVLTIQPDGEAKTTVEHHCTSSIGVVLFINYEAGQEDILKWADMAMYQAKESGRNQIRFYVSGI